MRYRINIVVLITALLLCAFGCSNNGSNNESADVTKPVLEEKVTNESKADSLTTLLHKIDSLNNSGVLSHLEYWKIGKISDHSSYVSDRCFINILVCKLTVESESEYFITLLYETGDSYRYRSETHMILPGELKYFYSAIEEMKNNYGRSTDHFEFYNYKTKAGATLTLRRPLDSNKWELQLCSLDGLNKQDLDLLKDLFIKAEQKIEDLKK